MPAADAVAAIPELRRDLLAVGNPLSARFWRSAEELLSSVRDGSATVGDVDRWLETSGSEPSPHVPGELFVWPDEDERGPVAIEMHALLVAYLESLVREGTIDPDRLLAGDREAYKAYQQAQLEWLYAALPDGRQPIWAVSDEQADAFMAEWDDAEADARNILTDLLAKLPPRPLPEPELTRACALIREGLDDTRGTYALLREAAAVDPTAVPDDDRELWLDLAEGVVTCAGDPPEDVVGQEAQAAWLALDHPSWIGAVVSLAEAGPGAPADADALARYAARFDFEVDGADGVDGAAGDEVDDVDEDWLDDVDEDWLEEDWLDESGEATLRLGFHTVELLWRELGAVDQDGRLTTLGWWGVPEALLRAWEPGRHGR